MSRSIAGLIDRDRLDWYLDFDLAKQAKECGFESEVPYYWDLTSSKPKIGCNTLKQLAGADIPNPIPINWNSYKYELLGLMSAPTIWDIIFWLCNRFGINICSVPTEPDGDRSYYWKWVIAYSESIISSKMEYTSRQEALEKGIAYMFKIKLDEINAPH